MKKDYKKPEIVFESFMMCVSVAACGSKNPTPTVGTCAYEHLDEFAGTQFLFTREVTGCTTDVDDGYSGICYHVPSETGALFGS